MFATDLPRCGRIGRTGQPCKSPCLSGRPACGLHLTEHEQAIYAAYQAGRSEAKMEMAGEYTRGFEAGRLAAQREIATTYPSRSSRSVRMRKRDDQYVTVQVPQGPKLAVIWSGPGELDLGDWVYVPSLTAGRPHDVAVVVALGSTSIGVHPVILGRVPGGSGGDGAA